MSRYLKLCCGWMLTSHLLSAAVANETPAAARCDDVVNKVASARYSPEARVSMLQAEEPSCRNNELFLAKLSFDLNQVKRYEDSQKLASRALQSTSRFGDNIRATYVSNEIGLGRLDSAEADARRFAKQSPKFAPFQFELAAIAAERHHWDQATAAITSAIELDPDAIYLMLRASYRYQAKDYGGTIADVQDALARAPARIANPAGLTEGIYALVMTGRRDDARHLLRRHIQANPDWMRYEPMVRVANELQR